MAKKKAAPKKKAPAVKVQASHPPGPIIPGRVLTFKAENPPEGFAWGVSRHGSPINGHQVATLVEGESGDVVVDLLQAELRLPLKGNVTGSLAVSCPGFEAAYEIG